MSFELGLAVLALVMALSALSAGLVERAPISFPIVFLAVGALLGPRALGLVQVGAESPLLEAVSTITLSLVLFLDGVALEQTQERRDLRVPLLALGPGTALTLALGAAAAHLVLRLPATHALLVGAALASTDTVVMRDLTRDVRIPAPVRRTLGIEAGANDVVVLPVVLVVLAAHGSQLSSPGAGLTFLAKLLVVGPLCGVAIGGAGAWLMTRVDAITPIRREHQSLYGLALVFGAYAAGATLGVDGFLAAFAAGLAVSAFGQRLCDCFLEYGAATSELAMMLSFVLTGALLSQLLGGQALLPSLLLAGILIFLVRPGAMLLVLAPARGLSRPARLVVAWFGPRGLTSLLLGLLVARSGLPGGTALLAVIGTVVVASVALHGATATPLAAWYERTLERHSAGEERESSATGLFTGTADEIPRITPEALAARLATPEPPRVLDVRTRSQHALDPRRIPGSVRVEPDRIADWAEGRPREGPVVLYCT